jgi:hypothetical protein
MFSGRDIGTSVISLQLHPKNQEVKKKEVTSPSSS